MADVFDKIEKNFGRSPISNEILQLLSENHWEENPLPMQNRLHRIAYWIFIEGQSLEEIAAKEKVRKERIRELRDKAVTVLKSVLHRIKEQKKIEHKDFGFDIQDVISESANMPIEEMKELLLTPVYEFPLPGRLKNALLAQRFKMLGDVLSIKSPKEFLKYSGFGLTSVQELDLFITGMGFKWSTAPETPQKPETKTLFIGAHLKGDYLLNNFVWTDNLKAIFNACKIETLKQLFYSKALLHNHSDITDSDHIFLQTRFKEWGVRW